jgi:hypothetical protein
MDEKETLAATQIREKRPRCKQKASIAIFLVLPVICILLIFSSGWILYLHGRFSPYASTRGIITILLAASAIFIVWCLITRIVKLFDPHVRRDREKRIVIGAEIGFPTLVFVGLCIIARFIPIKLGSLQPDFMHGFRDRVRSKADVGAIRDWLGTLNKEDCARRSFVLRSGSGWSKIQWPDSIDWPESVKVFRPYFIQFPVDDNDNLKIRLCWGTGMTRSWGVEIGPEDMKIPPSDLKRYGERRLPLEREVYVWHEVR